MGHEQLSALRLPLAFAPLPSCEDSPARRAAGARAPQRAAGSGRSGARSCSRSGGSPSGGMGSASSIRKLGHAQGHGPSGARRCSAQFQ